MTTSVNNTLYSDFGSLEALKKNVRQDDATAIRKAAQQFESLFTNMLLKSMREATRNQDGNDDDPMGGDSQSTQFYQSMFDQQLSVQLSQGKGLGLADMLVKQLAKTGLLPGGTKAATPALTIGAPTGTPLTGATGSASTTAQAADFVKSIAPAAQAVADRLGVAPETVIAHAALETGWGQHQPTGADGTQSNNLFGIKASGNWNGPAVHADTTEFSAGVAARKTQAFRAYGSTAEGFNDYANMLQSSPRYAAALGTGSNVAAFARGLQRGGYATDPDYAHKLESVAVSVRSLMNSSSLKTET
ncbi:MAG TPA: flagellar assembly peptidoglycan hydrolase FlgJ [Steroidobacteraceae bacterium]|nr:flagellar assembly peptidoglycan hydrolase FlgJ [Steroidobacteraceae bacterium]